MHELLTTEQMAAADRLTIDGGTPGILLMENAGAAIADVLLSGEVAEPVQVLCGPGNNGGDGYVAARLLAERGVRVDVAALVPPEKLSGDAAIAASRWNGPVHALPEFETRPDTVVVDAVFGAGLTRPVDRDIAARFHVVRQRAGRVIAVDVPSGLDGTTGQKQGQVLSADRTVTFFRRKPGHLLMPGRSLCGEVTVADIGIRPSVLPDIGIDLWRNSPGLWAHALPRPRLDGHKYDRGHALVMSGPIAATGAARLAAMAALRSGAGLVTLGSPPNALAINAAHLTAIMLRPIAKATELAECLGDARFNAVIIGPGHGVTERTAEFVGVALQSKAGVVLDADALTVFADSAETLFRLIGDRDDGATVMTPHEGEVRRLFPDLVDGGGRSKVDRARMAARRSSSIIVLKGADTVIAAPDGRAVINDNAPPWLATAGAGDVLGGIIVGFLAQGMPAFEAASAAVWCHGAAASRFGCGLIAEDLPVVLPAVLAGLVEEA